ncbi:MAG: hypothetical protein WD768_11200 [Phycisphaeraceae bacterium]
MKAELKQIVVNRRYRSRGAVAILAMMFLVIFSSLAAAMAIVSQGNLTTADSHLKINRSLAAAETGMHYLVYRLNAVAKTVKTTAGIITEDNATALWDELRTALLAALSSEFHNLAEPYEVGSTLHVGPIAVAPAAPTFTAQFTPHPIAGEDYDSAYYARAPYSTMAPPVSNLNPLDSTWIRLKVVAIDGPPKSQVTRSIKLDFRINKKINFAILSKSRVMIGRNVIIDGTIGSRFTETNLTNGHPVQIVSDFRGLKSALDDDLNALVGSLASNDADGDNRLNLFNASETAGITNAAQYDLNGDNYIDDYDFFLKHYDANGDGIVSATELDTSNNVNTAQLLELIDTFGDPARAGYNDGLIDNKDRYAKIHGQIKLTAAMQGWLDGAAGGTYQDYFAGAIRPKKDEVPLKFEASDEEMFGFTPDDFDVSTFKGIASGDLASQAVSQAAQNDPIDPDSPQPLGAQVFEAVPFQAAHPYDYYDRPIYKNMTFTNVKIPKGCNALFENCTFIGVTFIETEVNNDDQLYNYAGIQESDGTLKYPDKYAVVTGVNVADTKTISNNVRFHGCTFEGAVVSDAAKEFTHVRNKITFTGKTQFKIDDSTHLSASEKALYKRSTILMPHYSVEMGTFVNPFDSNEVVKLSGTIVAGLIDMRGQVKVTGTILTTFEPKSNTGPVLGETSPQFNTTLGYFPSADGDLESELPANGIGVIHVKYDPTIPLPDGILGPISLDAVRATWTEGGAD